jgi:hypothetical protein
MEARDGHGSMGDGEFFRQIEDLFKGIAAPARLIG